MLKSLILLSVIACALGASSMPDGLLPQLDGRIIGGSDTTITAFPWQISLQRNGWHYCGGSIYSNKIIVTAAHCLQSDYYNNLRIRAGSTYWNSKGILVSVAGFKNHEGFNPKTMVNDIAIIRLTNALEYGPTIKNIALATSAPANGAAATVTGWGALTYGSNVVPYTLQYIDTKIVERTQCASSTYGYGSEIQETMICAYASGKDSCTGDAGGPLVSDGVLVGVVSWGYGCAQWRYPGVYADVAVLRSWVINAADSV